MGDSVSDGASQRVSTTQKRLSTQRGRPIAVTDTLLSHAALTLSLLETGSHMNPSSSSDRQALFDIIAQTQRVEDAIAQWNTKSQGESHRKRLRSEILGLNAKYSALPQCSNCIANPARVKWLMSPSQLCYSDGADQRLMDSVTGHHTCSAQSVLDYFLTDWGPVLRERHAASEYPFNSATTNLKEVSSIPAYGSVSNVINTLLGGLGSLAQAGWRSYQTVSELLGNMSESSKGANGRATDHEELDETDSVVSDGDDLRGDDGMGVD